MNTRRMVLSSMATAALGGVLWYSLPERAMPGQRPRGRFPNVRLQDQHGRHLRFYDDLVRGKVVAINMMYIQCEGSCPTATANLRMLQPLLGERLGRDVFLYSISLQPELDTPEALKEYAQRHGARPGWLFLTGRAEDIRRLRYSLGFYDPVPEVDSLLSNHTAMLRIGNDRTNRWAMAPARCDAKRIITTINHVDTSMVVTRYQPVSALDGVT